MYKTYYREALSRISSVMPLLKQLTCTSLQITLCRLSSTYSFFTHTAVGDAVQQDELIAEVETDKVRTS